VLGSVALVVVGLTSSGCGATRDSNVVARVDDAELSRDQFTDLVAEARAAQGVTADTVSGPEWARVDASTARGIAGQFVAMELVRSDLTQLGMEVPESAPIAEDSTQPAIDEFQADYQALIQTWVAAPTEMIADDDVRAFYEQGPAESGIACVQHILVAEEAEAEAVLDRLEAGESFADVAAETSIDPQSAAQGGSLGGCTPTASFREQFVPEFVEGSLAGDVGVPTGPVETQFGHHVIRIVPFDELSHDDLVVTRFFALSDWHDVETDPEIGVWEAPTVVPLG